jgi:tripartite-type tricarboxylate transporter receptor subunit TctC
LRERIAADVKAVSSDPTIATRLAATGQLLNPRTPAEYAAAVENQRAKVAAIAKTLDLKAAE